MVPVTAASSGSDVGSLVNVIEPNVSLGYTTTAAAAHRHESHCLLWTCQRGGSLWQWGHFGQGSHQPGCNEIQESLQQGISNYSFIVLVAYRGANSSAPNDLDQSRVVTC